MRCKCRRCGDTVEVTRPKEFKSCKCGAIALDYGDEYYYRVCGAPEDFDGEIEDAPELKERGESVKIAEPRFIDDPMERAMGIIGEENIGGESGPRNRVPREIVPEEKDEKIAEQAFEYLLRSVKVKESFRNVNVDLCEDGTLWIDDAETDEQLAKFIIK